MSVVDPYPSSIDLAWAAGLWDGEGSVGHYPANHKGYLFASLVQKDRGVLDRLQTILPFGKVRQRNAPAPFYWSVARRLDVMLLAWMLWPHLSEVKRGQFERAITGSTWEND